MEKRYVLLIDKREGTVCYRGEGTVTQIKKSITELVTRGIDPTNLEVVPVVGKRINFTWLAVLGVGFLIGWSCENLRKRIRQRRREHSST